MTTSDRDTGRRTYTEAERVAYLRMIATPGEDIEEMRRGLWSDEVIDEALDMGL